MKVAIFGATGMVGKVLTAAALNAGHDIIASVRQPERLGALADEMTVITGDYFDPLIQRRMVDGVDAVLTTIGPPLKRGRDSRGYVSAMKSLVANMEEASVSRIVAVAGAGVKLGDEKLDFRRAVMRRMLMMIAGPGYREKEQEHNVLFRSSLDWTILRPPQISNASGEFTTSMGNPKGMKVDTQQLVSCMIEAMNDPSTIRTAPFVATI